MKFVLIALIAVFSATGFSQCEGTAVPVSTSVPVSAGIQKDIVDTAIAAGKFNTLVAAVKAADLVETLKGKGPFTVFAPTDAAFGMLPKGTLEMLLEPEAKAKLSGILTYHVVGEAVAAKDVLKRPLLVSVNGQAIAVSIKGDVAMVGTSKIIQTDIQCSNGIIHIIDAVMLPESGNLLEVAQKAGTFGTLIAAAKAAGLATVLSEDGPFTILAPSDEAFTKLPKGTVESLLMPENKSKLAKILKFHVISGRAYSLDVQKATELTPLDGGKLIVVTKDGRLMINKSTVVASDINASNGVIHVIDRVLLPE